MVQTRNKNIIFPEKVGCGKWMKHSDNYGWINCGDRLSENEDNDKIELCVACKKLLGTAEVRKR